MSISFIELASIYLIQSIKIVSRKKSWKTHQLPCTYLYIYTFIYVHSDALRFNYNFNFKIHLQWYDDAVFFHKRIPNKWNTWWMSDSFLLLVFYFLFCLFISLSSKRNWICNNHFSISRPVCVCVCFMSTIVHFDWMNVIGFPRSHVCLHSLFHLK